MAKAKKMNWGAISFVVVLLLVVGVFVWGLPQNISGDQEGIPGVPGSTCDSTTTPNLTIKAYDNENPGTALTEATNLYRIKGEKSWSTFTAGTGFAASVGEVLEIVMGITTSDFTDNAYGDSFEYVVPCKENPSIEMAMYNDEVETSLSATFYNKDDNAAAQAFLAGETHTIELRLKAGTDEFFGNPYLSGNPNVLVLELNSTTMDKPESVNIKGGADLKEVTVPGRQALAAGNNYYAYELPVIGDKEISIEIALNADDSNAPAVDDTAYIYAANWFINGDTANLGFGVENEEDAAVGTDASDSVTIDVTE